MKKFIFLRRIGIFLMGLWAWPNCFSQPYTPDPDNEMFPVKPSPLFYHSPYLRSDQENTISYPFKNAPAPLSIASYDSSGDVVHPAVIDFQNEYNRFEWGGYRYWMAFTPYPNLNAYFENPEIQVSYDGLLWFTPKGLTNPLVYAKDSFTHADPDIIYHPDSNEIWLYYMCRKQDGSGPDNFNLIRLKNNMQYSDPIVVYSNDPQTNRDYSLVSPAVWYEGPGRWHMWAVGLYNQQLFYLSSRDGIRWSSPVLCTDINGGYPFSKMDYNFFIWHICAKPNYRENRIEFIANARTFPWGHPSLTPYLIYFEIPMTKPTLVNTPIKSPLMQSSGDWLAWDNNKLYRTAFQIYNTGSSYHYKLWYSAMSNMRKWRIGFTEGEIGTHYTPADSLYKVEIIIGKKEISENTTGIWLVCNNDKAIRYQWFYNSKSVPGAHDQTFLATRPGKYAVRAYFRDDTEITADPVDLKNEEEEPAVGKEMISAHPADLYPNPASHEICMLFDENLAGERKNIELFDVNGQSLYKNIATENKICIDIHTYPSGIYYLHIQTATTTWTEKIIKQ